MATETQFNNITTWFHHYIAEFKSNHPSIQKNINLKYYHILRVVQNVTTISNRLKLPEDKIIMGKIIALFHDIGRFKQFTQYGTFSDKNSQDHAHLGIRELTEHSIFRNFTKPVVENIKAAIRNHNKKTIDPNLSGDTLLFTKLLRDADKIDILNVMTDYCTKKPMQTNYSLQLDLPNKPEYQKSIIYQIFQNNLVSLERLKTFNDFKLLQISWIFDINFAPSLEIIKENQYIEFLINTLPCDEAITQLKEYVLNYIMHKIETAS